MTNYEELLILEFLQDNYEYILFKAYEQLNYYHLLSIQLSQIARQQNVLDEIDRGCMNFANYNKTRPERCSNEMNEFFQKVDIATFNGYTSVEEFVNCLANYDRVMKYLRYSQQEMRWQRAN